MVIQTVLGRRQVIGPIGVCGATPDQHPSVTRFGSCELYAAASELRKPGILLKVYPLPFRT